MTQIRAYLLVALVALKAALLGMAYYLGRKDATARRNRADLDAATSQDRMRNEVDRDAATGDARDRMRTDWRR